MLERGFGKVAVKTVIGMCCKWVVTRNPFRHLKTTQKHHQYKSLAVVKPGLDEMSAELLKHHDRT